MRIGMKELFASIPPHTHDSFARVNNCSWSILGGPDQALLTLPDEGDGLDAYQHLLGKPVEIFTGEGSLVWWGYISGIRAPQAQYPSVLDLEAMANRVCAVFVETEPGFEPGQPHQTNWYENSPSQAVFGVKEKVLQLGTVSLAQAIQIVENYLDDHAWPEGNLDGQNLRFQQENKPSGEENPTATIEVVCRGWIHRLSWRTWQPKGGILGYAPVQVGAQKIGEVAANQRLAQSFKVEMTQDVSFIKLKLRKEGAPTDGLSISIQSDNAGLPSGTTLASATLSASSISADGFDWYEVSFTVLPRLTAGVTYWLVARREGLLNPSAYYLAGVDESAGYADGVLRIYNSSNGQWTARTPVADVLFRFGMIISSDELIRQFYEVIGQDFSGLQVDTQPVWTLVPFLREPLAGLSAFKKLLRLGGGELALILATVSPTKLLRVAMQPEKNTPAFLIDEAGDLCDRFGNPVESGVHPTGQWVAVRDSQPVFIKQASWEAETRRLTLNF